MATIDGKPHRRDFLRQSAGLAAGAAWSGFPMILPSGARGEDAPSERVRIGFIGLGGQGRSNLMAFVKEAAALCDVDSTHLAAAQAQLGKAGGRRVPTFSDYRMLLDDKDIDAVVVTTPDHWHALPTIDACAAGKDVYCEKPLSLTFAEGRAMVDAARRHRRVVQTGSQQRSDDRFRLACELVRNGHLGKLQTIKVGLPGVNFTGPALPDSAPPPILDYNRWLGPAPDRPYNEKRVHYNFRFFWDYSGGQMTNWGAHHLDIVQWALGRDDSGPVSVEARARFRSDGLYEVPEWSDLAYLYDDGTKVLCGQDYKEGITFEGEKGTLFVNRGKLSTGRGEIIRTPPLKDSDTHLPVSKNHHQNWISCIKTREAPICDVAIGHRSATVCHLGNIAVRTGRKITWDPAKEQIVGDEAASAMLSREYRAPWHLPSGTLVGASDRRRS